MERAGACCTMKTSPARGQLCSTQEKRRNESPMNGSLCATMTAALGESARSEVPAAAAAEAVRAYVRTYARTHVRSCVCVRARAEKLPRNVKIRAGDKEFESHSTGA